MTQKMLFNRVTTPNFLVPDVGGGSGAVLFHSLTEDPDELWALHLWVGTNNYFAVDGVVVAIGVPAGAPFDSSGPPLAFTPFQADPSVQRRVFKIADGVPIRGPMDIYASASGGVPADPSGLSAFGYIVRGEADNLQERRFFNISGPIGNQVDNFSGGQLAVAPVGVITDIHETDPTYIDEITLDLGAVAPPAAADPFEFAVFFDNSPTSIFMQGDALDSPKRVLDGIPVRDAGTLQVANISGKGGATPATVSGYFSRQ